MSDLAAIKLEFIGFRLVREYAHFIFSVPAEKGTECLVKIGGLPIPGESRWFGVARLKSGASEIAAPDGGDVTPAHPPYNPGVTSASGTSRPPTNRLVKQACMACDDPTFRMFLEKQFGHMLPTGSRINNEEQAADMVRFLCDVKSRREILPGSHAADKWDRLYGRFEGWQRGL